MDDKNQSSAISGQSSDKTQEATENVEETVKPEETNNTVIPSDNEVFDSEGGALKAQTRRESLTNVSPGQPASAGDPSPAEPDQDDTEEAQDDKKEVKLEDETKDQTSNIEPQDPASSVQHPTSKSDNPNAKWYVVHTYSGHENKVAHTLKQRIESEHLEEKILEVLVPMQEKIEIKSGKKVNVKEKIFPGYILVKMVLDDTSWLAVRTTQGVTSFVGIGNKPTAISESEVQTIVKFTQSEAPMYKQVFTANDTVKIVDGPFADFIGKIDSVDEEKGKVRVLVSIFGRETPVELDFLQIKKI